MMTKTRSDSPSLAAALPAARFGEHHHAIIDGTPQLVWQALHELRWSDLGPMRPIAALRGLGLGGGLGRPFLETFAAQRAVVAEAEPHVSVLAMIGKPWQPMPASVALDDLEQVRRFEQPGWLKYGMEWRITALPGGDAPRCLLETTTLCEPTDDRARRRFAAYWALIRVPSGLIRVELLRALARRVRALGSGAPARAGSSTVTASGIRIVHDRLTSVDLAGAQGLLATLATPADAVWPAPPYPPIRFVDGLQLGATGGHGAIAYEVTAVGPHVVGFRFVAPTPFTGGHRLEVAPNDDGRGTRWTHTLEIDDPSPRLERELLPQHDALIEALLDRVAAYRG